MKKRFAPVISFVMASLIISISGSMMYSQERVLSLDEAIRLAKEYSPRAKIAINDYLGRKNAHISFKAGYKPRVILRGSIPGLVRAINPITQPDGTQLFISQSQLYSTVDLGISQKIPLTGAELFLSTGLARTNVLEGDASSLWRTTPISFSIYQPLFQHNNMSWDNRIEDLQNDISYRRFIEDMEGVTIELTNKYFEAYITEMNLRNAEFNVAVNDTLYQISKGRFSLGKIAENDLLQSELALTNDMNTLETAKLDYDRAIEDLCVFLGIDKSRGISVIPPQNPPTIKIDLSKAVNEAKQNRSELYQLEIQKLQAEQSLNIAENSNDFDASLTASFGLNQTSSGQFKEAYQDPLESEVVNLTFQIPILQWGLGSAKVESAMAEKHSAETSIDYQKKNFEINVKYQLLRFNLLQNQIESSSKADTIAARRFEVAKGRYMIGKIDLNSFFIAQNEKNSARTSYIQTLKNYWLSFYELRRLTLYDFINDKALFEEYASYEER
jgi:hypothetical protein